MLSFEINNPSKILSSPLKAVLQGTSSKSPIPILEGILFELTSEGLTLTGSDLEQWIVVRVPEVKVESTDKISFVAPRKVIEALSRLPEGIALFVFDPERATLKINYGPRGKNSQSHQLYRADDYPRVPAVTGQSFTLKSNLKKVSFAVGQDIGRMIFTGVNINFQSKKITASDTFRMAVMDIPDIESDLPSITIPSRAVDFISRLDTPTITVDGSEGKLIKVASSEDVELISRLIPGRYPPLQGIMEQIKNASLEVEFSAAEMAGALNRVSVVLPDRAMPKFRFGCDGVIVVSAQSESGQAEEEVQCKILSGEIKEGEAWEVLLSSRYFSDALKWSGAENVTWSLTGQLTPSVIRGTGENGWLCIIVPGRKRE